MDPRLDFTQIGHFAAHLVRHVLVDLTQGQHQPVASGRFPGSELVAESFLNIMEAVEQLCIFVLRQFIQVLDNLKNIGGNGCAVGPNKRHPERAIARQGPLHLGHHFERFVVGVEQQLEMVIAGFKSRAKLLHIQLREWSFLLLGE